MQKNRVPLVLEIVLLLVVISSLVSCGSGRTSSPATPAATAPHRLDTGPPGLPLYCPGYLTHDQQGNVYVGDSDEGNQNSHRARVVKLSPTGQLLGEWHVFTAFHGRLRSGPFGLAVDTSGTVYVADAGDNTIKKLSPTGTLLTTWGKTGSAPGEFSLPEGVALDAQGNVYVADFHNSRIQKFTSTGTLLAVWGNTGSPAERLAGPVGVAIDGQDNVYVADIRNHRIVKFSPEGKFLLAWGQAGSTLFSSAKDIALDLQGNVYIADE
jgi:DNA-binding beta-propeller fold protein YncE